MWWIVAGIFQLLLKVGLCECCHCCAVLRWYKCTCRGWSLLFQFHDGLLLVSSEWLCHLTFRSSSVSLSLHDRWPSGSTNTPALLFRPVTDSLSVVNLNKCCFLFVFCLLYHSIICGQFIFFTWAASQWAVRLLWQPSDCMAIFVILCHVIIGE